MKIDKIYEVFTTKVSEYLADGYMIHPASMTGSQGEIGKVDLVKGYELIRVWLVKEYRSITIEDCMWYGDRVVLRVGKWIHPLERIGSDNTVWMSDLSIIEEINYYQIDQRGNWYLEDIEEAKETQRVHKSRYSNRINLVIPTHFEDPAKDIAIKYLKRVVHYKRVSREHVRVTKTVRDDTVFYKIHYNGHVYRLK